MREDSSSELLQCFLVNRVLVRVSAADGFLYAGVVYGRGVWYAPPNVNIGVRCPAGVWYAGSLYGRGVVCAPPNVNIGVRCPAGVFCMIAAGTPTWQSSFSCMVAKLLGACRTLASCTLLVRWPLGFLRLCASGLVRWLLVLWRLCAPGTLAAYTLASVRFWYAGCLYSASLRFWYSMSAFSSSISGTACLPFVQDFWYSISAFRPVFLAFSSSISAFSSSISAFGSGEQRQQEVRRHCDS